MAKMRRVNRAEEEFQMAPMIDMVFLLLVFFMVVSNLAQADKSVELNLPESTEAKVPRDLSDRGTVSIQKTADGVQLYIGAVPATLEQISEEITQTLKSNPDLKLFVRADQSVAFGDIKKVLKTCAEAGAYEVIYATYQK